MINIDIAGDRRGLDAQLAAVPNTPAVFLIWPRQGLPYLARTTMLRRRLIRLLRERRETSRLLNLRSVAARIEYQLVGSNLEASLVLYCLARRCFPETYLSLMKLRMPAYVKLTLADRFPRTLVTSHLGAQTALYFGPFRTRTNAEDFESQFLDLFQIRRCADPLVPAPDHPGCLYGEMGMCLRPCQEVVGAEEYASEAGRVAEFLASGGSSLVSTIESARDRLSAEMNFEEAARQHKRLEKVGQVLKLQDELARDASALNGVAVVRSVEAECVDLRFVRYGCWQPPVCLSLAMTAGQPVSLDQRLRQAIAEAPWEQYSQRERQEHLALLARWFYSTWRDGEWLPFESLGRLPYRKLVNAIHRVMTAGKAQP